jgi:hypothetical protein
MGMSGMTRGPKGYARNDTEPETGMSGMTRGPKGYARNDTGPERVSPEWHGAYMACPDNDQMFEKGMRWIWILCKTYGVCCVHQALVGYKRRG